MTQAVVKRGVIGAGVVGAAALLYRFVLRGRLGRWGATAAESTGVLPGDGVVVDANHQSTRAVDIDASAAEVWPWLVQLGQGRGGAYSYSWLQNLFRLDFHNADRVLPEFQGLEVGDTIPLDPSGKGPTVRELVPEQHMLLEEANPPWTWLFKLDPSDRSRTRLVVRNRVSTRNTGLGVRLFYRVLGPAVFLMERKMLLGIKERAEELRAERARGPSAIAA